MGKNILVTGGAGFVGSHLVDALLAAGHNVRILDVLAQQVHGTSVPDYLSPDAELIRGDIREADTVRRALEDIEVVFHLAAAVGVPSLLLWGETAEAVWRPRARRLVVLRSSKGLGELSVPVVARHLEQLLADGT